MSHTSFCLWQNLVRGRRHEASVGYAEGGASRERLGYLGPGPKTVITDLGMLTPDPESRELALAALHPGATVEQAKEATGWDLKVTDDPAQTDPPTARK